MECRLAISLFLVSLATGSVIIPEELPSLLSVAYSNIPPIKKGTDSRIGFGFAFGNHADFQVMLELGPQSNTMPLNGQPFPKNNPSPSSNAKRQAPALPGDSKIQQNIDEPRNYLQNWAQKMRNPQKAKKPVQKPGEVGNLEDSMVELVKNSNGEYEIRQPRPGDMPHHVLNNLKKLYGQKKEEAKKMTEKKRSEEQVKKITEELSDVELE
ncbi:uncharacterized protein LOC116776683 [Danaus plexippus]|uniref:uncharacterized protein LOC116776683 n=1 Tax=Danaus plexippus TaxID=13037 RepID=UPI002AB1DFD7|nr:uncharacterized protein LOC116776683 [Danaus plexippus]